MFGYENDILGLEYFLELLPKSKNLNKFQETVWQPPSIKIYNKISKKNRGKEKATNQNPYCWLALLIFNFSYL